MSASLSPFTRSLAPLLEWPLLSAGGLTCLAKIPREAVIIHYSGPVKASIGSSPIIPGAVQLTSASRCFLFCTFFSLKKLLTFQFIQFTLHPEGLSGMCTGLLRPSITSLTNDIPSQCSQQVHDSSHCHS